jgi:hypothetical protein
MNDDEDLTTANEKILGKIIKEKVNILSLFYFGGVFGVHKFCCFCQVWYRFLYLG